MLFCSRKSNRQSAAAGGSAMRILPMAVVMAIAAASAFVSCKEEDKEVIAGSANPETTPTMTTIDVNTLISDSGITRYKITTPLWYMFDEAKEPTWRFPDGLHVQTFDMKMRPEATIDCDTAIFYKNKQLWRLKGYVNIRNTIGEKFLTEELYWDQRRQKVYSDSFIHIERDKKVIEGYGFESNETMTNYHVLRVSGIFPAEQFKTDSTRRAAAARPDTVDRPVPGTMPVDPHAPHMIVSGKADDSHVKRHADPEPLPKGAALKNIKIQNDKPRKALSN